MANDPKLSPSRKRTAGEAGLSDQSALNAAKKRATKTVHHELFHKQQVDAEIISWFACQDHELQRQQLDRSLALALEAVGFDYADELALTTFRDMVEEYMAQFLSQVRASMLAARRRQPVANDFVNALARKNLTLRSLLPHLDPPVADPTTERHPLLNSKREIMPGLLSTTEEPASGQPSGEVDLLNVILNGREREARPNIIPASFPALPSRHTYKAQEVLPPRESDPQKIRERATEEGRLGEEALRRFTAKVAEIKTKKNTTTQAQQPEEEMSFYARADQMWKDLMLSRGPPPGDVDANATEMLSGPVNYESKFWRKPAKRVVEKG